MPPSVSVAMCVHNGSRYIVETLESVFAQTYQDFEVIIVDDGSTDDSVALAERHFADNRVRIIRQRQQTLRVARPVALANAAGEFIAFIDHDDVWLPHKLEMQLSAARANVDASLFFSDCLIVDEREREIGRLSDQFDFTSIDYTHPQAHLELLRRGNFVAYPTAFARTAAVRAVGGFDRRYQYVSDYDLWLRLARHVPVHCTLEPLAKYRVHPTQFTQTRSDITLAEHTALLWPVIRSSSYPRDVREALTHMLFGQHRVAFGLLTSQRRYGPAARAAIGSLKYPVPLRDYIHYRMSRFKVGRLAIRAIRRAIRVTRSTVEPHELPSAVGARQIWIDGTPLDRMQAGYFNLVCEFVRRWAADPTATVHVVASRRGRAALLHHLGDAPLQFHPAGWRAVHWTDVHRILFGSQARVLFAALIAIAAVKLPAAAACMFAVLAFVVADDLASVWAAANDRDWQRVVARAVRFAWRRIPRPWRGGQRWEAIEFLFWRGRFRFRNARRIAIVQDLTTIVHPDLHTPGNVSEFDEYLGYLHRHATEVWTVSESSKRDIISRTRFCPASVSVMPVSVHPRFLAPDLDRRFVTLHDISGPYVIAVGTLEPRKNLRRFIGACEMLRKEPSFSDCQVVIAGPRGWDDRFTEFLFNSELAARVRVLGFVPGDHLPSLYHFAKTVVYPSVYEGFGLPVLEAMCSSAIVITSRVSSLPEVLGDDEWLFDPYDAEDIARVLLRALELSASDVDACRQRNRQRAEARLTTRAPLACA